MLQLKSVNFEAQQFQEHQLTPNHDLEWLIGRHPTCDVVLDSPEISRLHGRIIYTNDAYHFIDSGSTSGSVLNGEIVPVESPHLLSSGDLLQLGETFIYIEGIETPQTQIQLPPTIHHHGQYEQWSNQDIWCRCDRIIQETHDVKTFCLVAEEPLLFNYKPGQFVTLEVEINGKSILRPYSISSTPSRPHHLTVTIKRVPSPSNDIPAGLVSNWMHDGFKLGDRLKLVGGPMGAFTCVEMNQPLPTKMLLISAGSGITPMMSMSRYVQDMLVPCDIVFLHSAKQPEDIVYRTELETLAAQMPNFRLAVTLTNALGTPWMGLTGRISAEMLSLMVPDWRSRSVFVCGPNPFMNHVRQTLETMGFPMNQYQEESFGGAVTPKPQSSNAIAPSPRAAQSPPAAAALAITFQDSDQTISTDGSQTILEIAEAEGITIRSACRMGACGACKLSCRGKVRYDSPPAALSQEDQSQHLLACVAYPLETMAIGA